MFSAISVYNSVCRFTRGSHVTTIYNSISQRQVAWKAPSPPAPLPTLTNREPNSRRHPPFRYLAPEPFPGHVHLLTLTSRLPTSHPLPPLGPVGKQVVGLKLKGLPVAIVRDICPSNTKLFYGQRSPHREKWCVVGPRGPTNSSHSEVWLLSKFLSNFS